MNIQVKKVVKQKAKIILKLKSIQKLIKIIQLQII